MKIYFRFSTIFLKISPSFGALHPDLFTIQKHCYFPLISFKFSNIFLQDFHLLSQKFYNGRVLRPGPLQYQKILEFSLIKLKFYKFFSRIFVYFLKDSPTSGGWTPMSLDPQGPLITPPIKIFWLRYCLVGKQMKIIH